MTPRGVIKAQLQHVTVSTVSVKPDEVVIKAEEVVVPVEYYPPEGEP